ncbi:MAG: superoxide dismutase [Phycisphaeraceae bacterium]|nr:superoxide dismutase [Phycisphaeraceae bacterium]
MHRGVYFSATLVLSLLTLGCGHARHHRTQWASVERAVAVMTPTAGNTASGVVTFTQVEGGVRIVADINGLNPNQRHAFHVHEFGDARDAKGKSAGGHYNPEGHDHGRPEAAVRHAGDLGNLVADGTGRAHYDRVDDRITIAGMLNPIVGRGVIIHAGEDQFTQPTGAAGARIAIGVIGIAK